MAREPFKRACCASSLHIATAVARLRALRESRLPIGGRRWPVGARPCTEGERLFAAAVPFRKAWTDYNQRGIARVSPKRACYASSPYTATAVARLGAPHESRLLVGSHGGHVGVLPCHERKRLFAGTVPFRMASADCSPLGMPPARRNRARFASSPQAATAVARLRASRNKNGCSFEAAAGTSSNVLHREKGICRWLSALLKAWSDYNKRGMARTRRKRACFTSSPQAATAVARLRAPRKSRLLVRGRGWHVGARPCIERKRFVDGAVPFRMALIDHNQRATAGARRRCTCCTSSPQTASAVARLHGTRESRLLVRGHVGHVGAQSCTEGDWIFGGPVLFHTAWADYNQRGMARVHCKRACCASSP